MAAADADTVAAADAAVTDLILIQTGPASRARRPSQGLRQLRCPRPKMPLAGGVTLPPGDRMRRFRPQSFAYGGTGFRPHPGHKRMPDRPARMAPPRSRLQAPRGQCGNPRRVEVNVKPRPQPMSADPVAVFEAVNVLVDLFHRGVRPQEPDELEVIPKEPGRQQSDDKRQGNGMPVQPPPEQGPLKSRILAAGVFAKGRSEVWVWCHHACTVVPSTPLR